MVRSYIYPQIIAQLVGFVKLALRGMVVFDIGFAGDGEMNHQERRVIMQRFKLSSQQADSVIRMVKSGRFTLETAIKYVKKDAQNDI